MKSFYLFVNLWFCLPAVYAQGENTSEVDTASIELGSFNEVTTLVKDNSRVILNWDCGGVKDIEFTTIERSKNGIDFETVAVLKHDNKTSWKDWVDEAPVKGRNYYRIRGSSGNRHTEFSAVVMALLAGDISCKFYPNPVGNMLIIRAEDPVDVHIIDATGKIRLNLTQISGLHTINVAHLEKGLYIIRINNKLANSLLQEKLVKQ